MATKVATTPAYHGNVAEKRAALKQLRLHRAADQIIQGSYWSGNGEGKGCAVGCLTHDPQGGHSQFPERWGIPVQLAYLIDQLFESLPVETAVEWPVRFMSSVPVGADLSRVWDRWCAWMLHDLAAGITGVDACVEQMAVLFDRAARGDEPAAPDWSRAARAAEAAWAAGAARAARAAGAAGAAGAAARHEWAGRACDELVRLVKAAA